MKEPARKMIAGEMELLDLIVEQIKSFNKPIIPVIDIAGFTTPVRAISFSTLTGRGSWPTLRPNRRFAHWLKPSNITASAKQERADGKCESLRAQSESCVT